MNRVPHLGVGDVLTLEPSALFETLGVAVIVSDLQGTPKLVNQRARELLQISQDDLREAIRGKATMAAWLVPSPAAAAAGRTGEDLWRELAEVARFGRVEERHVHCRRGPKDTFAAALTVSPVHGGTNNPETAPGNGGTLGFTLVLHELTAGRELEQRALQLAEELETARARWDRFALTDELTGLSNDRGFRQDLNRELKRAARLRNPLSLLLIKVVGFDNFPHERGALAADQLLQHVARLLVANGRETDFVARYRGDDFAVLLPDTHRDGSQVWAQRLHRAFVVASWAPPELSLNVGIATQPAPPLGGFDDDPSQGLIDDANRALHTARGRKPQAICHAAELPL